MAVDSDIDGEDSSHPTNHSGCNVENQIADSDHQPPSTTLPTEEDMQTANALQRFHPITSRQLAATNSVDVLASPSPSAVADKGQLEWNLIFVSLYYKFWIPKQPETFLGCPVSQHLQCKSESLLKGNIAQPGTCQGFVEIRYSPLVRSIRKTPCKSDVRVRRVSETIDGVSWQNAWLPDGMYLDQTEIPFTSCVGEDGGLKQIPHGSNFSSQGQSTVPAPTHVQTTVASELCSPFSMNPPPWFPRDGRQQPSSELNYSPEMKFESQQEEPIMAKRDIFIKGDQVIVLYFHEFAEHEEEVAEYVKSGYTRFNFPKSHEIQVSKGHQCKLVSDKSFKVSVFPEEGHTVNKNKLLQEKKIRLDFYVKILNNADSGVAFCHALTESGDEISTTCPIPITARNLEEKTATAGNVTSIEANSVVYHQRQDTNLGGGEIDQGTSASRKRQLSSSISMIEGGGEMNNPSVVGCGTNTGIVHGNLSTSPKRARVSGSNVTSEQGEQSSCRQEPKDALLDMLSSLGLQHHHYKFVENRITLQQLANDEVSKADLKDDVGVKPLGDRIDIIKAAKKQFFSR